MNELSSLLPQHVRWLPSFVSRVLFGRGIRFGFIHPFSILADSIPRFQPASLSCELLRRFEDQPGNRIEIEGDPMSVTGVDRSEIGLIFYAGVGIPPHHVGWSPLPDVCQVWIDSGFHVDGQIEYFVTISLRFCGKPPS